MSLIAKPEFQIEIDDRILKDETLRDAVNAATGYFIEQYEPRGEDLHPTPPALSWSLLHHNAPRTVQIRVQEYSPFDGQEVIQYLTQDELLSERARNINMLRLWRKLLELRSQKRFSLMETLLQQAEQQEAGRGIANADCAGLPMSLG